MRIDALIERPQWRAPVRGELRPPEVLAPAGNEEMMRAAVENGADAIYFGLQHFNARMRAANFDSAELPRIMAWLHERGVKGYVTLNTLVFPSELDEAAEVLLTCSKAGVDAVLVQDLGIVALANALVPDLPVHASTQMTLTSAESIAATEALGLRMERLVMARELSRRELQTVMRTTDREIEVFVHGALCVAYSGQCLTSEALGGRSANRGECAQACRLPYDMVVDGEKREMGDVRYLLSPRDLAAYEDIGDLMRLGIASLKIEGRLKSPQYVAATVQSYRAAIESVLAAPDGNPRLDEERRRDLEMTFSRGFTGGYLHEIDHQAVVEGRFPKKRGLLVGRVASASGRGVVAELTGPLKPGDGVVFDAGTPDEDEQGGRVYTMHVGRSRIDRFDPHAGDRAGTEVLLTFGGGAIDPRAILPGQRIWLTSDPARDAALAASYEGDRIRHRDPVNATVRGGPGRFLQLELRDADGITVTARDTEPAEPAQRRPLTREVLLEQLGRMGNTPFQLKDVAMEVDAPTMVPLSRLNELRRAAVEALIAARRRSRGGRRAYPDALRELRPHPELQPRDEGEAGRRDAAPPGAGVSREPKSLALEMEQPSAREESASARGGGLWPPCGEGETGVKSPTLSLLCRTLEQVEAAVSGGGIDTIYTDFEDIRLHREARRLVPAGGPRFVPATLRIVKPGEAGVVRKLYEAEPDAILVRNLAAWQIVRTDRPGLPVLGDYSLNVANEITAGLLVRNGIGSLVPSYDLNIGQLLDLLRAAPARWFEVTIHQYMPMFHMEHCVFCRFLSKGTDFTNCGRPCESHSVRLRDRVGWEHPVKADAGCRNTVFNAAAQSASAYLPEILAAGVTRFRADLLLEDAAGTREVIDAYLPAVTGREDGRDLWRRLRARSKLGVTRGSLDHD